MKHNFIRSRDGEHPTHAPQTTIASGLPVVQSTRKVSAGQLSGWAVLVVCGVLLILRVPFQWVLVVGWVLLLAVVLWLWAVVVTTHREATRRAVVAVETDAAIVDVLQGPHDTNLKSMLRRLHELERDHAQLSEVVTQCVTWDDVPGGRPTEDAA